MISCVFISLSFSAPAYSYLSIMSSSSRRKSLPLPTYGPLLSFFLSFSISPPLLPVCLSPFHSLFLLCLSLSTLFNKIIQKHSYQNIGLSVYLSVYPSVHQDVCPSVSLSFNLPVVPYLFIHNYRYLFTAVSMCFYLNVFAASLPLNTYPSFPQF